MPELTRQAFAVIPTRDRPTEFATCVAAIRPQVDTIIAVCHGRPAWEYAARHDVERILYVPTGRANISHMWNLGLDAAEEHAARPFDVAVLNDDAIPGPDWFVTVTARMHAGNGQGASERRAPGLDQIAGWAFILNGDAHLRADEQFVHWHGDGDLQRQAHPWVFFDDVTTPNTLANTTSRDPEAREQIRQDDERFDAKWST